MRTKKKILLVTSFYPPFCLGGDAIHVKNLAEALAGKGHEVHVLYCRDSFNLKSKGKETSETKQKNKRIHLHEFKSDFGIASPVSSYIFGYPFFKKRIKKLFNQNFDVIHYHNISLLGPKILQYGNALKIYTAHDHWLFCPMNDYFTGNKICSSENCAMCLVRNKRPLQLWRYTNLLEKGLMNIDMIISPSHYLKNKLVEHNIRTQIKVIPNFVPDLAVRTKRTIAAGKNKHNKYFLYVGALEKRKGVISLLNIFSKSDKRLYIAGRGNLSGKIKENLRKGKLKNIKLLGWKNENELEELYREAQAFILPSICPENSPLTVLESLSLGTPVICSDTGGTKEIIRKVDKDLIFGHTNFDSLRKIIQNFNPEKYPEKKLIRIFRQNFSEKRYMREYEKIIR